MDSSLPNTSTTPASTADAAIEEARRLGLRVTFGPEEVSESGGFGVPYAAHGGSAALAFIDLVKAASET